VRCAPALSKAGFGALRPYTPNVADIELGFGISRQPPAIIHLRSEVLPTHFEGRHTGLPQHFRAKDIWMFCSFCISRKLIKGYQNAVFTYISNATLRAEFRRNATLDSIRVSLSKL